MRFDNPSPKLLANREAFKRWREKNKEREAARKREAYFADLEASRARSREKAAREYALYPERVKERNQRNNAKRRDKILANKRLYYIKNREKRLLYSRKHYAQNKARYLAWAKAWNAAHREFGIERGHRYRALKNSATINLRSIKSWMASIRSKKKVTCYWCGAVVSPKESHFDHIVALSKGGGHSVENLCVSCAPCNCSKADKPLRVWIKTGQQVLEL